MEAEMQKGEVILYHPSETIKLEVRLENETVWLNRQQLALLFDRDIKTIGKHINNALKEELNPTIANFATVETPTQVVAKFATSASNGKVYQMEYYNLDMILSVGYRVKSYRGVQFRAWANSILKQYLLKGYNIHPQLSVIQNQIIALQEHTDNRIQDIERHLERHDEQIDLYIKTNEPNKEQLFGNGCVFDAWSYISDLVRSAKTQIELINNYVDDRFLIIDDDVYMLGNSVKDFGNAWGVVIKMEMCKYEILAMLEKE